MKNGYPLIQNDKAFIMGANVVMNTACAFIENGYPLIQKHVDVFKAGQLDSKNLVMQSH